MLKLIKNEVPVWAIDWVNTNYTASWYISLLDSVVVDWVAVDLTLVTDLHNQITVPTAPVTSITISFFLREERDIEAEGLVSMWDLIDWVYLEIGRKQYSNIYSKERIRDELNKTIKRIFNQSASNYRLQQYWFKGTNWLIVSPTWNTIDISTPASYNLDIEWAFLVWKWLFYTYFDYDGVKFTVSWDDLIDSYDRIIVWHRIPYWVDKPSEIYVDWFKYEYVDNRDFYVDSRWVYTIFKDYQGNQYLFLPYSTKEYTVVVKFVPDKDIKRFDEDTVDIPYEYTIVPIYEVVYRLLASREDERWQFYKSELVDLKRELKWYRAKANFKQRAKIWLAETYWVPNNRDIQQLPDWVYDEYI
jgi:hypothetical protein